MGDLRTMIEHASWIAERIFAATGRIYPMWHIVDGEGRELLVSQPEGSKDQAAGALRELFKERGVTRCLLIDEAWTAEIGKDEAMPERLSDYPGRSEVLFFQAEDIDGGQLVGRRVIVRDAQGHATLGPLSIEAPGIVEGRFVGMLPGRGRAS